MYQHNDLYTYVTQLYQTLQSQQEQLASLQNHIVQLTQDLTQLKNAKPINIEKIEYHFDQLKVETLEGTLNIGLTPSTISDQVDELSVNGKEITGGLSEGTPEHPPKTEPLHPLMSRIEKYLAEGFYDDIARIAERYQVPIDPEFYPMIMEDIQKQIEPRIRHYLKQQNTLLSNESRSESEERIYAQTKQDIRVAIENFIRGLPHK